LSTDVQDFPEQYLQVSGPAAKCRDVDGEHGPVTALPVGGRETGQYRSDEGGTAVHAFAAPREWVRRAVEVIVGPEVNELVTAEIVQHRSLMKPAAGDQHPPKGQQVEPCDQPRIGYFFFIAAIRLFGRMSVQDFSM
jgi:hypothetical protein